MILRNRKMVGSDVAAKGRGAVAAAPCGDAQHAENAFNSDEAAAVAPPLSFAALHDDVVQQVLATLDPEDLAAAALAGMRLRALAYADPHWRRHYAARWPPRAAYADDGGAAAAVDARRAAAAAALAGSWRALYACKAETDKASAPWRRPCEYELQAAVQQMAADALEGAAAAAAGKGKGKGPAGASGGGGGDLAAVFLLDGSGSVGEEDFLAMSNFVTTAAAALAARGGRAGGGRAGAGAGAATRVAAVQFSNSCRVEAPLALLSPADASDGCSGGTIAAIAEALARAQRMNGGTNIAVALATAGALLKAGAPPGAGQLVVLLTDGRVDGLQAREAKEMAARLADERAGVALWALGVGRGVDEREMLHVLSGAVVAPAGLAPAAPAAAAAQAPTTAAAADPAAAAAAARYLDLCVRDDPPW